MAVEGADKFVTTNAKDQSQNIALLIIAVFLVAIYFLREFYLQTEPAQITPAFSTEQTVVEIEDPSGNSKVYTLSDEASLKDVIAKNEKRHLNPSSPTKAFEDKFSKGERGGLNYSDKVKSGSRITINKDGFAQVGLMSGEKHLIFSIPLDINKATVQDFEALPGIGPKLAEEIIATRKRLGGFKTSDGLKKVKGIGDKKFERIRGRLTVNSATPSPPPSSSAAFQ